MNKTLILSFLVLVVGITARNQKKQISYQTADAHRRYTGRRRFGYFRRTCSYEITCYFSICL